MINIHDAEKIFEEARLHLWNGMNETEVKAFQTWRYDQLQTYLLEHNITTDKNWINNSLKPQMKKAMIHILRMTSFGFLKRSNVCSLQGMDFVLDENLKLWFIETNPTPMIKAPTIEREKILISMLTSYFEINFAYLRSRLKRIIQYVNKLSRTVPDKYIFPDAVFLQNYHQNQIDFNELNRNYLEPEFSISAKNTFELIVDENIEGVGRYAGILPEECMA